MTANLTYSYSKRKLNGTASDDIINAQNYYTEYSKDPYKGLIINGGNGNDEIWDTVGNDTITGGKGDNTIHFNSSSGWNDRINLTKGENLIIKNDDEVGSSVKDYSYSLYGKDVSVISYTDKGGSSFTIKNLGANIANNVIIESESGDIDLEKVLYDAYVYGKKFNGCFLSENIIGYDSQKHNIKAGAGDDIITAGKNDDTITGGVGNNKIIYKKGDGNDTIVLTKNENLIIDLQGLTKNDLNFSFSKGNLLIKYIDENNMTETITIKSFAKKDIVGYDGSVYLTFNGADIETGICGEDYIELRKDVEIYKYNNFTDKKTSYTGNWLNETIDATSLNSFVTKKNKGVSINGNAGADNITGSIYNDTLKGGNDDDEIYSDAGNDKIYGGNGLNKLYFKSGNESDTVYSTSGGYDTLVFEECAFDNLKFTQEKNNLVITGYGTNNDKITIINFYQGNSSVQEIITSDKNMSIAEAIAEQSSDETPPEDDDIHTNEYDGKHIVGTNGNDRLNGTDKDDIIHGKLGADKIYGKGGNDILDAIMDAQIEGGDGDDYISVTHGFSTIKGDNGNDTIYANSLHNSVYGGDGDDYIQSGNASYVDAGNGNDEIHLYNNYPEPTEAYGGEGDDYFYINSYNVVYGGVKDENTFSGNDYFEIDDKYNKIYTEDGNNTVKLGGSYNEIYAKGGNDILNIDYDSNDNYIDLGDGNNTVNNTYTYNGLNNNTIKTGNGIDIFNIEASGDSSYNNAIYSGDNNDRFNLDSDAKGWILNGEGGDDTYILKFNTISKTFENTIFDSSGSDSVNFVQNSAYKEWLNVYVNIHSDKTYDNDLIIINEKGNKLTIKDYLGDGKIETISSSDGYDFSIDKTDIENLSQSIASWLNNNGYDSVQAVVDSGNTTYIDQVTAFFNTYWE